MKYSELSDNEKLLFDRIDGLFMKHASIDQKSFVRVLALLINKHKRKKSNVEMNPMIGVK